MEGEIVFASFLCGTGLLFFGDSVASLLLARLSVSLI